MRRWEWISARLPVCAAKFIDGSHDDGGGVWMAFKTTYEHVLYCYNTSSHQMIVVNDQRRVVFVTLPPNVMHDILVGMLKYFKMFKTNVIVWSEYATAFLNVQGPMGNANRRVLNKGNLGHVGYGNSPVMMYDWANKQKLILMLDNTRDTCMAVISNGNRVTNAISNSLMLKQDAVKNVFGSSSEAMI